MDVRKKVAVGALLLMPLATNAPVATQLISDPPPATTLTADHSILLGYITQGDSNGWKWSAAFTVISGVTCATMFAVPPGAVACAISAGA